MNVQKINGQTDKNFGNKVVIESANKGAVRMIKDDIRTIALRRDGNIRVDALPDTFFKNGKSGIIVSDTLDKDLLDNGSKSAVELANMSKTYDPKGYTGALRSEFEEIVKSENPVNGIVEAIEKHFIPAAH